MAQYATREVPNLRLIFLNQGTQVYTLDCDTVIDYTEDFNSTDDTDEIRFYCGLLDKEDIDCLESKQYSEILVYRSLIMRNADTGEDELYFPPTLTFHKLEFEYSLNTQGDVVQWMIRLWN